MGCFYTFVFTVYNEQLKRTLIMLKCAVLVLIVLIKYSESTHDPAGMHVPITSRDRGPQIKSKKSLGFGHFDYL